MENKGPLPKYTNYHALTALLDHVYVLTDRNLYRPPEPMKGTGSEERLKETAPFTKT